MAIPELKSASLDILQDPLSDEASEIDTLIAKLRSSSAPLPSFVDEKFLASAMHLVNSDTRHMHEDREWIRTVTGFPWPEERPSVQEIPRLYLDALRYPAFAIVFQHQFFADDNGRGLPKNQILMKNRDFWRRLRSHEPHRKNEADLSVLRALHAADNGGDKDALLAELLGLPGQAAWKAKCSKASAGLDRLEAREGDWGELGRYLRAVVGPFCGFGDELTIGDVMEEIVIPRAMQHARAAEQTISGADRAKTVAEVVATDAHPPGAKDVRVNASKSNLEELDEAWRLQCNRIEALARSAGAAGPADGALFEIRDSLAVLEELKTRAAQVALAKVSTAELSEVLRGLTARAAGALTALIGDALNAGEILSRLFNLPSEALSAEVEQANGLRAEAEASMAEADSLGAEIGRLEATLPIKQARQQTAPLIDAREQALRRTLDRAESALDLLSVATPTLPPPTPSREHPDEVAAPEVATTDIEAPTAPAAPITVVDDIQDLPIDEEPLEEAPQIAPVSGATEQHAEEGKALDPLRDEVAARLDTLFAIGEHGLAFHLRTAASSVMPESEDSYTTTEFRLASAAGRAVGLSGQDLQSQTELRSEALAVAQTLYHRSDDRSIARLSLLLAGAIPAALFRSDDAAAVLLVESIGRLKAFEHYRKFASAVEENRKFGFPLTPANLMAAVAHSREHDFIADAVGSIKETISGFKSTRFRFQLGERLRHALTHTQGLLGRLASQLSETNQESAREAAEQLRGRDKILRFIEKTVELLDAGQEIDGPARERIFAVLSRVGQQCADLIQSIEGFNLNP